MAKLRRETKETQIRLEVRTTGGAITVATDDPFLTHMVETLARYAGLGLSLEATGDLKHHLVEDVAIALGLALARDGPAKAERYGWATVPMDDAVVRAALDLRSELTLASQTDHMNPLLPVLRRLRPSQGRPVGQPTKSVSSLPTHSELYSPIRFASSITSQPTPGDDERAVPSRSSEESADPRPRDRLRTSS